MDFEVDVVMMENSSWSL